MQVLSVNFSSDCTKLAFGTYDDKVAVFDVGTQQMLWEKTLGRSVRAPCLGE